MSKLFMYETRLIFGKKGLIILLSLSIILFLLAINIKPGGMKAVYLVLEELMPLMLAPFASSIILLEKRQNTLERLLTLSASRLLIIGRRFFIVLFFGFIFALLITILLFIFYLKFSILKVLLSYLGPFVFLSSLALFVSFLFRDEGICWISVFIYCIFFNRYISEKFPLLALSGCSMPAYQADWLLNKIILILLGGFIFFASFILFKRDTEQWIFQRG